MDKFTKLGQALLWKSISNYDLDCDHSKCFMKTMDWMILFSVSIDWSPLYNNGILCGSPSYNIQCQSIMMNRMEM